MTSAAAAAVAPAAPLLLHVCLLLLGPSAAADRHAYVGTGAMRSNPERGFRNELHGACTGEWGPHSQGFSDEDMADMLAMNLTIAQVLFDEPPAFPGGLLTSPATASALLLLLPPPPPPPPPSSCSVPASAAATRRAGLLLPAEHD